jgi:hypothetical protein
MDKPVFHVDTVHQFVEGVDAGGEALHGFDSFSCFALIAQSAC